MYDRHSYCECGWELHGWTNLDPATEQLVFRVLQMFGPSLGVAREDDVAARAVMLGRDRELEGGV